MQLGSLFVNELIKDQLVKVEKTRRQTGRKKWTTSAGPLMAGKRNYSPSVFALARMAPGLFVGSWSAPPCDLIPFGEPYFPLDLTH